MSNYPPGSYVHVPSFSPELARAAGWRPPAQVVETATELDALPPGAVVMDSPYPDGEVYQRTRGGLWVEPGFDATCTTRALCLPATVLWSPTEKAGSE